MKLHAQTSFYANAVDFWLVDERGERRSVGTAVTMEDKTDGLIGSPTFSVSLNGAQELFEELWRQGFRSAHDKGNSEALDTARREHIADLRKAAKLER